MSLSGLGHLRGYPQSDDVQVRVLGEAEVVGEGVWGDLPRALFAAEEWITHLGFALAIPTFEGARLARETASGPEVASPVNGDGLQLTDFGSDG